MPYAMHVASVDIGDTHFYGSKDVNSLSPGTHTLTISGPVTPGLAGKVVPYTRSGRLKSVTISYLKTYWENVVLAMHMDSVEPGFRISVLDSSSPRYSTKEEACMYGVTEYYEDMRYGVHDNYTGECKVYYPQDDYLHPEGPEYFTSLSYESNPPFSDLKGHTVDPHGGVSIEAKTNPYGNFGGSACYFIGDGGSCLVLPNNNDWSFGSEDFAIEMWVSMDDVSNFGVLVCQWDTYFEKSFMLSLDYGNLKFQIFDDVTDSEQLIFSLPSGVVSNAWSHVAVVRHGNVCTGYVNGISKGTGDMTGVTLYWCDIQSLSIGAASVSASEEGGLWANQETPFDYGMFNGWMDEVRITKGVARYTSDFAAPRAPFLP